jgi:ABC-type lipoprotein export system ATPase subunit
MKPPSNTFSVRDLCDLMEISYKDLKHALRIIEHRIPSESATLSVKEAETIYYAIRKQRIDWGPVEERRKKELAAAAFPYTAVSQLLVYADLICARQALTPPPALLGVASIGGHLRGPDGGPFIYVTDSRLNVIIGDRGSGKSTLLNLISGLGAQQLSRKETILESATAAVSRIVATKRFSDFRVTLSSLGISAVVYVHCSGEVIRATCLDVEAGWCQYVRHGEQWAIVNFDEISFPFIYSLRQGDVFRLADVQDDEYVFAQLFDSLSEVAAQRRGEAAQYLEQIRRQHPILDLEAARIYTMGTAAQAKRILQRSNYFVRQIRTSRRRDVIARSFMSFVDEYGTLDQDNSAFTLKDFQQETTFIRALWLAPIVKRLRAFRDFHYEPSKGKHRWVPRPLDGTDGSAQSFEQALAEVVTMTEQQADRLDRLVNALRDTYRPTEQLKGYLRTYIRFLHSKRLLMSEQTRMCRSAVVALQEFLPIRLRADPVDQFDPPLPIALSSEKSEQIINSLVGRVFEASIVKPSDDQVAAAATYTYLVKAALDCGAKSGHHKGPLNFEQHGNIVRAELRQGNRFSPFSQLSFGQRSAVLLGVVLGLAEADVVVLDQPEDNLDASGVIQILSKLIEGLSRGTLTFVATHNSNLAMAFPAARVHSIKSTGSRATVASAGVMSEQQVARSMLNILEGGDEAFVAKMKMYRNFLRAINEIIKDTDISVIERIFRNITIQGLIHHINPVITEGEIISREVIAFAQHEMKEEERTLIAESIADFNSFLSNAVTSGSLPSHFAASLSHLLRQLDLHVRRVSRAISEMEMLDLWPTTALVDLGKLVASVCEDVLPPLLQEERFIRVDIDEKLCGLMVWVDENHLRLVIRNLLGNCLDATLSRAADVLMQTPQGDHEVSGDQFEEIILFKRGADADGQATMLLADNGCGLPNDVLHRLYRERVSTRFGSHKGLGAMIISKLLDVNRGSVSVLESHVDGSSKGTLQEIRLPLRDSGWGEGDETSSDS